MTNARVRPAARAFRSLVALKNTASTSRVLNLGAVAERARNDPDYSRQPLFKSVLNRSIILKHHLRQNEKSLFEKDRNRACKILLPYAWTDLSLGGRSVFIGQRGMRELLQEELGIPPHTLEIDIATLELIDQLPSLDPFLLREHLKRNGRDVAACYFDITANDSQRMQDFVANELKGLIGLASGDGDARQSESLSRMVQAILSVEIGQRLEPLRLSLGMSAQEFAEGAFSWRGFLYYKWVVADLSKTLPDTLRSILSLSISGPSDHASRTHVALARAQLVKQIQAATREVYDALNYYDEAFESLIKNGNASAFRNFLLSAPAMFIAIGEKLGTISHICSFWHYRFPVGHPAQMASDEVTDIFREFDVSMAKVSETERNWMAG